MKIIISSNIIKLVNSNKIVSALNGNSLSFLRIFSSFSTDFIYWVDGIIGSFYLLLSCKYVKRTPGFYLLKNLLSLEKKLVIISTPLTKRQKSFLPKNNIRFIDAPFFKIDKDYQDFASKNIFTKEEIIVIAIASPKQEILASEIYKLNKNTIFCLGGALNMVIGVENRPPQIISHLGLEWLWRLRHETFRRILRIFRYTKILVPKNILFLMSLEVSILK